MAEIRLSKLTKQFSIGLARLVDFLNEKGANVEMNPNAKVSDEYLPAIEAKFGEDLKLKKDSEKVTIKLKEIIEMGSKKKSSREEEEVLEREVVIKTNVLNSEPVKEEEKPAAQVVEKPAAPVVEKKEEPKPVQQEVTVDSVRSADVNVPDSVKQVAQSVSPATCLAEDMEFTMKLTLNDIKVGWAHDAIVYDEKPLTKERKGTYEYFE